MNTPLTTRAVSAAAIALVVTVALAGCKAPSPPAADAAEAASKPTTQSAAEPTAPVTAEAGAVTRMTPVELQASLEAEDTVLINVCTSPKSGEIAGTDMAIAYNKLESATDRLPADKDARIALYCISGGMSKDASETLTTMGYTNVIDMPGGTKAWRKAGLPLGERTQ